MVIGLIIKIGAWRPDISDIATPFEVQAAQFEVADPKVEKPIFNSNWGIFGIMPVFNYYSIKLYGFLTVFSPQALCTIYILYIVLYIYTILYIRYIT